ncbi:MAG: cytochrome c oxidase assembly protein [Alphaproteobacteria bacterium]|nr:cytochrome c oxidase assembly protein [Alphaproteobacteria bacterium]
MQSASQASTQQERANRRVAYGVAVVVLLMTGMSFAAVPLYRLFCQVTGFGGTPMVASQDSPIRGERTLTVRFDANVATGLPLAFEPDVTSISARTGETKTVFYKVRNLSNAPVTAMATYNVAPDQSGAFFNKLQCFCFNEQTLAPGETIDMPVVFFLDPALEKNDVMRGIESVTLSYTFVPVKNPRAPATARAQHAEPGQSKSTN